ncbi:MAG: SPFH domain-containing protein [Acetobacteraceae bacterium]|nr:SPFH domain-containing protein [Acetobacteraceae bacterium]
MREIVGADGRFATDEISEALRNVVPNRIATVFAAGVILELDLAANQQALSDDLTNAPKLELTQEDLDLTRLLVANPACPPEVEAARHARTEMGVAGELRAFAQFQAAEAMAKAAANAGGAARAAVGLGTGVARGRRITRTADRNPWAAARSVRPAPAPLPAAPPPPDRCRHPPRSRRLAPASEKRGDRLAAPPRAAAGFPRRHRVDELRQQRA